MPALIAVAGLAAGLGIALGARGSYFTTDDHVFFAQARETPFGWEFLTEPIFDHLSPWHRLQDHLVFSLTGHGWWLAVGISLLWFAVSLALFTAVVRELVGRHPAGVLACLLFAASPLFLRAAQWWALAAQALPQLCFTLLAIWAVLRWRHSPRLGWLALALAAYALALLGFVKGLLVPLFLVLVLYLLPGRAASVREAVGQAWRRDRWLWAGVAVLTGGYLVAIADDRYYSVIPDAPGASFEQWAHYLATAWFKGVVPLVFDATVPRHLGAGSWAVVAACQAALLALVVLSVARRRALATGWLGAGAIVAAAMVASGGARLSTFGSHFIALDPRYTFEGALALLLVGAVALATVAPRLPGVAVAAVAAVCAGFAVDAFLRLERDFNGPEHRAYFETFDRSRAALGEPAIVDAPAPDFIVSHTIVGANLLSRVLTVHDPDVRVGAISGRPAMVDATGRVRAVALRPEAGGPRRTTCAGAGGPRDLVMTATGAGGGEPRRGVSARGGSGGSSETGSPRAHVLELRLVRSPRPASGLVIFDSGVPGGEEIGGFRVGRVQTYVLRLPARTDGWRTLAGIGRVRAVAVRPDPGQRICVRRASLLAAPFPV